ncbi:MAG: membrane protein insertase YidC [Alphaproteobacteria bacterium]|nr:membrane protein insertase YidC [Alphaproteobacteria bacterium]
MKSQNSDDNNNLLVAVLLSMAVLFAWQVFFPPPKPQKVPGQEVSQRSPGEPGMAGAPTSAGAAGGGVNGAPGGSPGTVPAEISPRVKVKTSEIEGSISLKGARIDDVQLVSFHETPDPKSPKIALLQPSTSQQPYFAEFGWLPPAGSTAKVPGGNTLWNATEGATLTETTPLVLTWDNGEGLSFKRTITADDHTMFTVTDEVSNESGNDVVLHPYARVYRHGTPKIEGFFIQHEGLIGWLGDENRLQEITYADILDEEKRRRFEGVKGGWIGFADKYWATAIVPDQSKPYSAQFWTPTRNDAGQTESFQADFQQEAVTLVKGGTAKVTSRLFAGAKRVDLIEAYEEKFGILEFSYLVDWGWFYFITKPLYYLLSWLNQIFGNFGMAILATTVIVKAAFFPLANRAYASMAQMKKLQPEMEKLKAKYPDDKQKQQQELMQLYQKEKVNPLAGCLPILLQIPVFFALYKVLFVSIDMRHAPFYGWIKDLSAPDPTSLFNLFGLLPYDVPSFLMVGAWPLLMGITMWLQMQLNPTQPDPTQQMIFNWMPVMFTFLLATFPAGLVIYWAWNNILSLFQQYFIMKRQGVDVPLLENIKKTFAAAGGLMPGKKSD